MLYDSNYVRGLKDTAAKYGAVMLMEVINYVFVAALVLQGIYALSEALTGQSATDKTTDIGYTFTLILNAVLSYAVPFLFSWLLFRDDIARAPRIPAFRSDDEYRRLPLDTAVLFLSGVTLAGYGSYITGVISEALNALAGIPEPEAAFSDMISANTYQYIVFEISSVIVAPLAEECLYRHILLKPLRKYGDLPAVLVSSLLFSLSHFNFDQFLYTFILGFFLGVIAIRSGSVVPSIICHMINNAMVGLTAYLPETFGNVAADTVFKELGEALNYISTGLFYVGGLFVVLAVVMGLLRFHDPDGIGSGKQLKVIFGHPLVIIGIVSSVILTFILLF